MTSSWSVLRLCIITSANSSRTGKSDWISSPRSANGQTMLSKEQKNLTKLASVSRKDHSSTCSSHVASKAMILRETTSDSPTSWSRCILVNGFGWEYQDAPSWFPTQSTHTSTGETRDICGRLVWATSRRVYEEWGASRRLHGDIPRKKEVLSNYDPARHSLCRDVLRCPSRAWYPWGWSTEAETTTWNTRTLVPRRIQGWKTRTDRTHQ